MTDRMTGGIALDRRDADSGVGTFDGIPVGFGEGEDVAARPGREARMAPRREAWRAAIHYGGEDAANRRREHLIYAAVKQGGALAALVYVVFMPTGLVEWSGFAFFYVLNILGMSIGYHRYFTHKAFETSLPMRYVLGALAQCGVYGSLKRWCADHRRHHAYADRAGDIHSPYVDDYGKAISGRAGLKHAHLAWAYGDAMTNLDIYGKGIVDDPVIEWSHRTRWHWFAVSAVVAPAIWGFLFGGVQAVVGTVMVAGFLRLAIALHAIAAVNSFGHRFGYQNFVSEDRARNNPVLGYLTLGEGWHNNHHAHPRGYSTQMRWYEIDMTGWVIAALEKLGLIWDVQRPDMHARPHHR